MVAERRQLAKRGEEVAQELVAEQILTNVNYRNFRNEIAATKEREAILLSQLKIAKRETRREEYKVSNLMEGVSC